MTETMDFKIKSSGYDSWDIYHGDKVVATIETYHGFSSNSKSLYIAGKVKLQVCKIKNQKEALEKLEQFFKDNKKEISTLKNSIAELEEDMKKVSYSTTQVAIQKEIELLSKEVEVLEGYDLV